MKNSSKPEISKHDLIKAAIFAASNDLGIPAIQEYKGKDWRADVYVVNDSNKFAFEVQMTPQSLNRTLERQGKYIRDEVFGCWLFEKPLPKLSNERPDLPLFYVRELEDKSLTVSLSDRKELPLRDFLQNLLTGNIKFCDVARTAHEQKVKIVFYEMKCWKCKEMNHIYYVEPIFRSACNAKIHAIETLWGSDRNVHRPEIISLAREFIETSEGKYLKLGEIKQRPSKTVERSYMSFGCYKCDSIFGEWFVRDAELEVMYGDGVIATIERSIKLGENIQYPIPHWCYPGKLPFCDISPDYDEEFQSHFLADGYGSLVKAIAFRSSSLNHLGSNEILAACILGYYSLFHFCLSLVMFYPEKAKTKKQRDFLVMLKDIRAHGSDPQNKISHIRLIDILRDMGLDRLTNELEHGKRIREFYNYGPRTTLDKAGNLFFGNPISVDESEKIKPENAIEFCKHLDEVILTEFSACLPSMGKVTLFAIAAYFEANSHYLEDESFHLVKLFSNSTIESSKRFLSEFKNRIDSRVSFVNEKKMQ